jgi:hypothetical protein
MIHFYIYMNTSIFYNSHTNYVQYVPFGSDQFVTTRERRISTYAIYVASRSDYVV